MLCKVTLNPAPLKLSTREIELVNDVPQNLPSPLHQTRFSRPSIDLLDCTVAEAHRVKEDSSWDLTVHELKAFIALIYVRGVASFWLDNWGYAFFQGDHVQKQIPDSVDTKYMVNGVPYLGKDEMRGWVSDSETVWC
ncbi:activating transcription factor 7-interacting 1 isoform X2 [Labeo rohita]|uniref:Activating transcription factor 7-interacting 1 isoform X2 n=1 Tax=Labeo rohita TaxID=84645 RepID=A0A498MMW4_LABRO|nr:activating transcription factor 7-interacting 1 isoform X2 [Labeo rohita]